ncbi:TPA: hypothetical protein PXP53_000686 [Yersinia enterocolitica]|nr:hypothetical protein [Yersinia enterocolitica]HDL7797753.1 hypothetical protein [Yersinia enterocolitica]
MHKAKSQGRYLFIFVTHSVRYSDHQPEMIYCYARTEREAFQYIHRKVGKYISVRMIACVRRRSGWHFIQHFTDSRSLVLVASCFGRGDASGAYHPKTESTSEVCRNMIIESQHGAEIAQGLGAAK